jgi:hypothetical protein
MFGAQARHQFNANGLDNGSPTIRLVAACQQKNVGKDSAKRES